MEKVSTSTSSSVSRHPASLAAYLTGIAGGGFLLAAPQAEAAVTSVTFGFGSVLSVDSNYSNTATSITPNLGTIFAQAQTRYDEEMGGTQNTFRLGGQFSGWNQGTFYQQRDSYGAATFLPDGAIVGGGSNGNLGMAYFAAQRDFLNVTSDQSGKNLGFQTSTGNWGWANVNWDATAKALTFNSAYVESVAGTPITIGDTGLSAAPEPSRALLALAGLAGVALRRRRKQVA